ncbi:MAG TPA: methyltransferase domain-containing protein [Candidatus Saccharimonadia bacterium]|nr:methyltransferase domain-containing protein [Candidatus Saccharimonadia bacterium]
MSWTFLREFIKNCQNTGAVAPSSPQLARQMMKAACVSQARNLLELGPGTGAFTEEIQKALPAGSSYLGLEMNGAFVSSLKSRFPRLNFEHAAAQDFDYSPYLTDGGFDTIVSGLPWAALSEPVQAALLESICSVLKPGGVFATFVYTGIHLGPRGQKFRRLLTSRIKQVETTPTVWCNLPPAFIYIAQRTEA